MLGKDKVGISDVTLFLCIAEYNDGIFAFNPSNILGECHEKIFFFKIPDSNYCPFLFLLLYCVVGRSPSRPGGLTSSRIDILGMLS